MMAADGAACMGSLADLGKQATVIWPDRLGENTKRSWRSINHCRFKFETLSALNPAVRSGKSSVDTPYLEQSSGDAKTRL
jgi:hypothetical protein